MCPQNVLLVLHQAVCDWLVKFKMRFAVWHTHTQIRQIFCNNSGLTSALIAILFHATALSSVNVFGCHLYASLYDRCKLDYSLINFVLLYHTVFAVAQCGCTYPPKWSLHLFFLQIVPKFRSPVWFVTTEKTTTTLSPGAKITKTQIYYRIQKNLIRPKYPSELGHVLLPW